MIPKLETCVAAVEAGVDAAVILDGRVPHAMLLEIFTRRARARWCTLTGVGLGFAATGIRRAGSGPQDLRLIRGASGWRARRRLGYTDARVRSPLPEGLACSR